ncbi:MAG: hypothetical protein Q7T44_06335 [Parvibaculum sp.]|nr:hypothetical protein [Parvibaculum sp.]
MRSSAKRPDPGAALLAITTILFPVLAAVGIHWLGPWPIVVALIVVLSLRIVFPASSAVPAAMTGALIAVVVCEIAVSFYDPELAARLYPVFMNLMMLVSFAVTLWKPPSMIERFARITDPDLDAHGVGYTRKVTWVWIGFFMLNGSMALWTALYGTLLQWSAYNGAVSYGLAGVLMAGEYAIRRIVRHKKAQI